MENSWLITELYRKQKANWPENGKHIMAQYTEEYVVVYQAYKPEIGKFAAGNQYFGGDFSYDRMSWIKPNFLWMMFRSGWGTKQGQETTLAIFLKLDFFQLLLKSAFPSINRVGMEKALWKEKVANTDVRLQWDPDHNPYGDKVERRAIQLGLRKQFLEPFKGEGIVRIEDISGFVTLQRRHINNRELDKLITPLETTFKVDEETKLNLLM
jgi:hypothetical protein